MPLFKGVTKFKNFRSVGNTVPDTSDAAALGTTSLMWSDLFLASGGVINFNAGDVTITHGANALTISGGDVTLATGFNMSVGGASAGAATNAVIIANGTTPAAGVADSVQVYSIDDAAGHTIPGFYCEGTNVVATGQADSVSSVRVKIAINGTTRTFLCI